jgi:hypothetical protein
VTPVFAGKVHKGKCCASAPGAVFPAANGKRPNRFRRMCRRAGSSGPGGASPVRRLDAVMAVMPADRMALTGARRGVQTII